MKKNVSKFFIKISSLLLFSISSIAYTDSYELPLCPNGAKLTGGYAPAPWPTCAAFFSDVLIRCLNEGKIESECRVEMQAAADAKDNHSQCLWEFICSNKAPGSNKVVTRIERMNAETACK